MGADRVRFERLEKRDDSIIEMLDLLLPDEFSLAEIALKCGKHRDTIRKYLQENFLEGEDYRLTAKGGKIYIARDAALSITRHYAK